MEEIVISHVRSLNMTELAALYNVSTKIIRTWLQPHMATIGKRTGYYFTALQVRIIFSILGDP